MFFKKKKTKTKTKALMTYQHVDDKGKDQGLNVRNRAKEIILLLNSNDRIREERGYYYYFFFKFEKKYNKKMK